MNSRIFAGMYENEPYSLTQYQERLKDKKYFLLRAMIEGQLVGNAVSYVDNNGLYLWVMGVDKNFRRQGIANQLLDHSEKIAKENNLQQVSAKVYDVSPEMKNCLVSRAYELLKIEESKVNKKYNANYYLLKLK
ncbi:MAG: GNAT family N-acetyltransferase [Patescibacteria group bacterium]